MRSSPPSWGVEREQGDMRLAGLPAERAPAQAWSRGEAWSGLPPAVAIRDLVVAGPGERVPAMPWPALQGLAVRRGEPRLASPGGQVVTLEPEPMTGSLFHLGGPQWHGAVRLASEDAQLPASVTVETTPERSQAAANAGYEHRGDRIDLIALGSSGEGSDGLLMADGTLRPSYDLKLRGTALARRWSADGQTVDRFAGGASLAWSRRASFSLGSQLEQHADIQRAALYTEASLPVGPLTLQGGARGVQERQGEAHRRQLAPHVRAAWRLARHDLELVGSAWGDPGMWMPEGVGAELPATRTLQLMLHRSLGYRGELWGGLRRIDAAEPGDLAAVLGLEWRERAVDLELDGAISPAGRWSTASGAIAGRLPRLETGLGLVSTWRSVRAAAPPPGLVLALPWLQAAHLDTGARLAQPIELRAQTLVLEGTLWTRLADSDATDSRFVAVPSLGPAEVAVRLQW
jgi:hypothetical protein